MNEWVLAFRSWTPESSSNRLFQLKGMDVVQFQSMTTSEIKEFLAGIGSNTSEKIGMLAATIERLRLERDMLALNGGRKDPCVFVVMNGNEVDGVVWPEQQTGSSQTIKFPSYRA